MDYLTRMARRIADTEEFVPRHLESKDEVRKVAELVGVRVPEAYAIGPLGEVLAASLPERFVLKPIFASTAHGVHLLRREIGEFRDLLSGDMVSRESLFQERDKLIERDLKPGSKAHYVAEEILEGVDGASPPEDIKLFCFQGEIGLIAVSRHFETPVQTAYFDGEFLPFIDVDGRYWVAPEASELEVVVPGSPPDNWREILSLAKRISVAVPSAFCRVDLYNTSRGVYLGELTFYPGHFYYGNRKVMSSAESERLGRMWERAQFRLSGSVESERIPMSPEAFHFAQCIPLDELSATGHNAPITELGELRGERELTMPLGAGRIRFGHGTKTDVLVVNKGARDLVVALHGATNRPKTTLPRFEWLRSLSALDANLMFVSDSTLEAHDNMWLGWYTGREGDQPLHRSVADASEMVRRATGSTGVIFAGSSGGGFAALQCASYLPGSAAFASDAQTDISAYLAEGHSLAAQRTYLRFVWPGIWGAYGEASLQDRSWALFADDRVSALRRYAQPRDTKLFLLQNVDEFHYTDHYQPFVQALHAGGNAEILTTWERSAGPVHAVPPPRVFVEYLTQALEAMHT